MNFAGPGSVDYLYGHKLDVAAGGEESEEQFGFNFKMIRDEPIQRRGFEIHQTKSALGIGQRNAE